MEKFPVSTLTFLFSFLLVSSSLCYAGMENERTLAMVKPDGLLGNHTGMIKKAIVESGFRIVREMQIQLDAENASLFYAEHSERSFFPRLIEYITSGPVIVMVLEKFNAISHWRDLIGPTDARKARISHPNSKGKRMSIAKGKGKSVDDEKKAVWDDAAELFLKLCAQEVRSGNRSTTHLDKKASGLCAVWILKGIVFMVQILLNLLPERFHFSLEKYHKGLAPSSGELRTLVSHMGINLLCRHTMQASRLSMWC